MMDRGMLAKSAETTPTAINSPSACHMQSSSRSSHSALHSSGESFARAPPVLAKKNVAIITAPVSSQPSSNTLMDLLMMMLRTKTAPTGQLIRKDSINVRAAWHRERRRRSALSRAARTLPTISASMSCRRLASATLPSAAEPARVRSAAPSLSSSPGAGGSSSFWTSGLSRKSTSLGCMSRDAHTRFVAFHSASVLARSLRPKLPLRSSHTKLTNTSTVCRMPSTHLVTMLTTSKSAPCNSSSQDAFVSCWTAWRADCNDPTAVV
mmetsp:Transcript_69063/g.183370  ORF Transcript_69063/g.183370 Transcript_69063/m.183370 type:complete len:266 (+) Transcript_69063:446-1243(+)